MGRLFLGVIIMMITAYFDESNTSPNQRVPIVAGYLASTFQWSRFNEKWRKLLVRHRVPIDTRYGIPIAHRNKIQHCQGPFSHWEEKNRDEFLEEACQVIQSHTRAPIGNAVFKEEFEKIIPPALQRVVGGPYGWCIQSTLRAVKSWCEENDYKKPINYVFEAGAPGYKKVNQLLLEMQNNLTLSRDFHIGGISFENKKLMPLQAAAFISYDMGRYALDFNLQRPRQNVFMHLNQLLGPFWTKKTKVVFWDGQWLQKLVARLEESMLPLL